MLPPAMLLPTPPAILLLSPPVAGVTVGEPRGLRRGEGWRTGGDFDLRRSALVLAIAAVLDE